MTRVLLIDSYDSFTHNLAALVRSALPESQIHIIKNDEIDFDKLVQHLHYFTAVIVGPGPGSPQNLKDIGVVKPLWRISEDHLLPIFGVCLGLQSLAVEYGASLGRLKVVKHGQVSFIHHRGEDIFAGVGDVEAVRYHSLHVQLQEGGDIQELGHAVDEGENGRVVMAVKHRTRPFWAVQYHPESVKTHGGGKEVLVNFLRIGNAWSAQRRRQVTPWDHEANALFGPPWPTLRSHSPPSSPRDASPAITTLSLESSDLPVTRICELLGVCDESSPFVLLESVSSPGEFTIIGSLTSQSTRITYSVGDATVSIRRGNDSTLENLGSHDIWSWIASFMRSRKVGTGTPGIPFWGGLVGYLSYETGVDTVGIASPRRKSYLGTQARRHPDVNLVFVERSVVIDSDHGSVYVQSLIPDDGWVRTTLLKIRQGGGPLERRASPSHATGTHLNDVRVFLPAKDTYMERIRTAKEHLFAGDSYELCLTANTRVLVPHAPAAGHRDVLGKGDSSSWGLYKASRKCNPAPHAAYLRLYPSTMISASPERFLSFSRPPGTVCQLRPIKGTVRNGPGVTRNLAEQALVGSTKEVAENLMIVDLIRHDLHGVVGEDVRVTQFCGVEEYKTVWQMVSVIEGKLQATAHGPDLDADGELGWEVLRRSLPPGSMTGAPKKRSIEILQTLEDEERGIYSGVFGYWCVGGGGDWAVTIRSCFKFDDSATDERGSATVDDEWVIGAGGAITALSDPEAEWDEMVLKLQGVLKAFGA